MKRLLPVGSVVTVVQAVGQKFMIIGYLKQSEEKIYDYMAVPYPIGLVAKDTLVLFYSDEIQEICHVGFCDEECEAFTRTVPQMVRVLQKAKSDEK